MPPDVFGTLSYRSTKIIDTRIGFEGQDVSHSQITGDRAILISNDSERQTDRLDNISHKRRQMALNPDALDDALAKWVPVNDSGHDSLDLNKMDSISGASTSVDHGKKRKSYKSSVCGIISRDLTILLKAFRTTQCRCSPASNRHSSTKPCVTTGSGTPAFNKSAPYASQRSESRQTLPKPTDARSVFLGARTVGSSFNARNAAWPGTLPCHCTSWR
jgi:hypothetical protein